MLLYARSTRAITQLYIHIQVSCVLSLGVVIFSLWLFFYHCHFCSPLSLPFSRFIAILSTDVLWKELIQEIEYCTRELYATESFGVINPHLFVCQRGGENTFVIIKGKFALGNERHWSIILSDM